MNEQLLTQCAAGLAASLSAAALAIWFFSARRFRRRIAAAEAECLKTRERNDESIGKVAAAVDRLAAEVRELPATSPAPAAGPPRPGMNLHKRSQILRLTRRGDSPEQIAACMDLPLQEVHLLLKVHRIVLQTVRV